MTIKLCVLAFVLVSGIYNLILAIVQKRSANNPTPENVSDVFDAETYVKWKKYSAENSRLSIASTIVSTLVSLALLAANVHSAFASLFGEGLFPQLLSIIILETVVGTIVSTVFGYIRTMKIEEKYGFNRSSMKTFVFDVIRGLIIGFILSLALITLLAVIHRGMGDWLILLFACAVFLISLAISFLYPIFSRIGNKFVPLEEGDLKDRLMSLLTKHGYTVKAIEVMDASRRTTKLNAYFTGFGKMKTIVLYDNLINAMTPDEICAVFAHELGHGLHKDVLKQQVMNFFNLLIMAVIAWVTVREGALHEAFGFDYVNYGFAYVLMSVGLGLTQPLTSMLMNAYSRFAEYRADRQAVTEGYGEALIGGLKKLAKENFAHLAPSKINVVLEYSHPPLSERINAIEKELKKD